MLKQHTIVIILASIIIPIGGVALLSDVFAQCISCHTQPGEQAFSWVVIVKDYSPPFEVEYKVTDVNGNIAIQGIFPFQLGFNSAPPDSGGFSPGQYIPVNSVTNPGPYTVSIRDIDPNNNNWVPMSSFCMNAGQGGEVGILQPDGMSYVVPFVDRQIVYCNWKLIQAPVPDLIPDSITDNLDEIVESLEDKDKQIQNLLDQQAEHDGNVNALENIKVEIDGETVKLGSLNLQVDALRAALELILLELAGL